MESTLRLFRALPIASKNKEEETHKFLAETLKRGFVVTPEVIYNYNDRKKLISDIEKVIGLTGEKLNQSFHKSWEKVRTADIKQLVIEQIIHYLTTYGFEALGIYDKDSVYIPNEKLEIPELKDNIKLIVIKGYTKEELKEKVLMLLQSGIALKQDTVEDIVDVAIYTELDVKDIESIKNKETKAMLYEYLNIIPESPVEFLRLVTYIATNTTLLIKSPELIGKIRETERGRKIHKLFADYEKQHGLHKLARIFYRYKPLFISFKSVYEGLKPIINKIRRLAPSNHKPMPEDFLNEITAKIKKEERINITKLKDELKRVNTFRKIRLLYALNYKLKDIESILYKIRNGKSYATEIDSYNSEQKENAQKVFDAILKSIVKDINKNVKSKKIYIPGYINYALPATEKQFIDCFPSGTCITMLTDMVAGIHWENVKDNRIDLDLSLMTTDGKIGWDADYRSGDKDILFSGDITDPGPKGATESFYVSQQKEGNYLLLVNYFNYDKDIKVPFKLFVAREEIDDFSRDYMVNPNNVSAITNSEISTKQKILGLLSVTENECKFYFVETSIGKSISSSGSPFIEHAKNYLVDFYKNTIDFKDILTKAGAKIVSKEDCDIDLSPENIEKDSILKLIIR